MAERRVVVWDRQLELMTELASWSAEASTQLRVVGCAEELMSQLSEFRPDAVLVAHGEDLPVAIETRRRSQVICDIIVVLTPAQARAEFHLLNPGTHAYLVAPLQRAEVMRKVFRAGQSPAPAEVERPIVAPPRRRPAVVSEKVPLHALIIDDEPVARRLAGRVLERDGWRVSNCPDGRQAMDMIAAANYDLVLIDMYMPHVDGMQLLEWINRTGTAADTIKVVLSSDRADEAVVDALDLGAHDFLSKPFSPTVFIARVRRLIRLRGEARPRQTA